MLPLPSEVGSAHNPLAHGRIEYRVQLKNTAKEDRIVHLQIPAPFDVPRRRGGDRFPHRSDRCRAGSARIAISIPRRQRRHDGDPRRWRIEGRDVAREESQALTTAATGIGPETDRLVEPLHFPGLLSDGGSPETKVGPAPPTPPASFDPYAPAATGPSSTPMPEFSFFHSELPITGWSPNSLGYSCFDVVFVTAKDIEQMPPEVQLAIRRYLECGGALFHGKKVPPVFSQNALDDGQGRLLCRTGSCRGQRS